MFALEQEVPIDGATAPMARVAQGLLALLLSLVEAGALSLEQVATPRQQRSARPRLNTRLWRSLAIFAGRGPRRQS